MEKTRRAKCIQNIREPEWKRSLERRKRKLKENTEMYFKEKEY